MKKEMIVKVLITVVVLALLVWIPLALKRETVHEPASDKPIVTQEQIPVNKEATNDLGSFAEIDALLTDARFQGATTAISIRSASTGDIKYARLGDTRVHPASVMKLFTGAAAFETLGEDHVFKTEVFHDGKIEAGVLKGNLYLRGQGDPTLMKKDIDAFVQALQAKGVQRINGNVYGDDTWFDGVRLSQDLNWSDESFYTGSAISGLTLSPNEDFDAGTVIVEVFPAAKAGQPGTVGMVPSNQYMTIINETKTIAKKGQKKISVERQHGTNTLVVTGTIPVGTTKSRTWASVWEPTDFAVSIFQQAISEQGITFSNSPKTGRKTVPEGASLLASKDSMTLQQVFIPFMKLSNNGLAEVLVKEMGKVKGGEGSWDKGLAIMKTSLTGMDLDTKNMLLRDGSGMSHKNLVTANEVTKLLYTAQKKPWYPSFIESLPIAGNEERFIGGTLRHRMKGTVAAGNVRAKTGALNGVAALSGYVQTKDGETLIFSVMVNNYLASTTPELLDQIAVILANHSS